MDDSNKVMTRIIAPPTKLESAPYGTLCSVLKDDEGIEQEIYVQASEDENDPLWVPAKDLLVLVYEDELNDPAFLRELLEMRKYK